MHSVTQSVVSVSHSSDDFKILPVLMMGSRDPESPETFESLGRRGDRIPFWSHISRCYARVQLLKSLPRYWIAFPVLCLISISMLAISGRPTLRNRHGATAQKEFFIEMNPRLGEQVQQDPFLHVSQATKGAYPGYPQCNGRIEWLRKHWNSTATLKAYYTERGINTYILKILLQPSIHMHFTGVTGTEGSFLDFLNQNG